MLILRNIDGAVLLERRPPTGIWGGLWSLPECTLDEDTAQVCTRRFALEIGTPEPLRTFRHSFTHYHLDVSPVMFTTAGYSTDIMERSELAWVGAEDLPDMGLPAPVRRLLEGVLGVDEQLWQEQLSA